MNSNVSTNASGLFALCLVLGFLLALALTNGLIERLPLLLPEVLR
jgi:hypothetical protein